MRIIRYPARLLLYCAGLGAQTAGFGGIAINSVTGQPLSGVHLELSTLSVGGGVAEAYGAMSGRDGRFSVTGIPAGTYVLLAERTGFVHMMTATGVIPLPGITLKAGEHLTDFKLEMTPRAVIAGRVIDEYGDPVPNVRVEATPVKPGGSIAARASGGSPMATTSNRGEFRISGGPGTFYIKATPAGSKAAPEIRTDGTSDAAYGPTWYPAAASADRASAVEAHAGVDVAIEIRLNRLVRQRLMTITGTISGIPQGSSARISLGSADSSVRSVIAVAPDGKFTVPNLPPAVYRLTAYATGSGSNLQSQSVDVRPDGPDTVEVQLTLTAGVEATGTLEIAGNPPGTPMEKMTVTLGSSTATTEPDSSFKITGIFPNRYRVGVQPLADNGYVKTVELDGVTTSEQLVDFAHVMQGSRLKITLARDGAQLSGTVLDKDGHPLGNTVAVVILAPDRDHILPNQDGMVKEGGKYSLKGIRPGKYLLLAVDAFRSGPLSNEEDLQKLAEAAEEIEIKAGEKITRDLKVVVKEDVDARSKK